MKVTLKLFASLTDYLPNTLQRGHNHVELDVNEGVTVAELIGTHQLPEKLVHLVLVNGAYVTPEQRGSRVLVDRDVLAIWPPIAGG